MCEAPRCSYLLIVAKRYHGSVQTVGIVMCPQAPTLSREELGALGKGGLTSAEDIRELRSELEPNQAQTQDKKPRWGLVCALGRGFNYWHCIEIDEQ